MVQIILLAIVISLTFYGILLVRSFEYMSITELKRQARSGEPNAMKVYPVRAYGVQLWIFLWAILGFLTSTIVILLDSLLGPYWTILINVPLIIVIHSILPWTRRPKPSLHLAAMVSPAVERILRFLYPLLKWFERFIGRWIQPEPMLLIQSKQELIEILHHNAEEFDHVNKDELRIAENALTFGEKLIGEYMTPLGAVMFIDQDEILSPVVLGELHDSGYSRFPVYTENNQKIVGTLYIKDALRTKNHVAVKEIMRPDVFYINEQQTLDHALQAFIKTKHHLFVVVNEFEDVVGILTVEDVIEQIIGKPMMDEFDQFDDLRAVAAHLAAQKHSAHKAEHL